MGIIVRQSIFNSISSYIGIVLGFIVTVKLFPTIMSEEQYGLTRAMLSIMMIGGQVALFGSGASIVKFFPELREQSKKPESIYPIFLVAPLLGGVILLGIFIGFEETILSFFIEKSPLISQYYYTTLLMVFGYVFFSILDNYLRSFLDTTFSTFLLDISLRIVVITNLTLFYFDYIDFDMFILVFAVNHLVQFSILFFYIVSKGLLSFKPSLEVFSGDLLTKILTYSSFSFLGGFAIILIGNIDMLMISSLIGLDDTAIYAVALYIATVIAISKRAIQRISFPIISESFQKQDFDNIRTIYKKSALNQLLFGLLIFIGVWANLENLFDLLPPGYREGGIVILIIGVANLIDLSTGVNRTIIIASKYYRFDLFANLFLIAVAFTTNLLLIPTFGIKGAALATATSILLFSALKVTFLSIKYSIHPFTWKLPFLLVIAGIVYFSSTLIPALPLYIDILIRSGSITLLYIALILSFKLSEDVNRLFSLALQRVGINKKL